MASPSSFAILASCSARFSAEIRSLAALLAAQVGCFLDLCCLCSVKSELASQYFSRQKLYDQTTMTFLAALRERDPGAELVPARRDQTSTTFLADHQRTTMAAPVAAPTPSAAPLAAAAPLVAAAYSEAGPLAAAPLAVLSAALGVLAASQALAGSLPTWGAFGQLPTLYSVFLMQRPDFLSHRRLFCPVGREEGFLHHHRP